MGYRRQDWPLTNEQLEHVIALGETRLVEFKREWWNGSEAGLKRAKFAKALLSLANSVGEEELALLVIGIDDESRQIVPIVGEPTPEGVNQILNSYIAPPADVECRHYALEGGRVSAIVVRHSASRPHWALRDCENILSTKDVYVRRGAQVGVLTGPELTRMIREHDMSEQLKERPDPIQFGFLAFEMGSSHQITARVQNVMSEPIADVFVSFDARQMRDSEVCARAPKFGPATLKPGEIVEITLRMDELQFYKFFWDGKERRSQSMLARDLTHIGDRWLDLTMHVRYRDADGLIRVKSQGMPLSW